MRVQALKFFSALFYLLLPKHKNEIRGGVMRNSYIYVAQLPIEIRTEIRARIAESLTAAGDLTEDNLQRAMDGRLSDLDEVLDTEKYAEATPAMKLGLG